MEHLAINVTMNVYKNISFDDAEKTDMHGGV